MIEIVFIVPEESMKALAIKTFAEHNHMSAEIGDTNEYHGQFMVTLQPELYESILRKADILVARGVTALNIKRHMPDMFVVEIPFGGNDILSTIIKIVQENGRVRVGIVNAINMVHGASNVIEYLGAELKKYIFDVNSPEKIQYYVDQAIKDGCRAIMGGIDTCEYARSCGIPAYPLPMSRESIWQAISEAKHNAHIRNQERANAILFQTVLQHSNEGIVATNRDGKIMVLNNSAERILGVREKEAVGEYSEKVLGDCPLNTILRGDLTTGDTLVKHLRCTLSVQKARMILNESYIGDVVTFQDVASIQKAEGFIRDKLNTRGHVARYSFSNIIGSNKKMQNVVEMAKLYATIDSSILIQGETGTGKELLAQSIHNEGRRKTGPFVAVNCAALSRSLIESELFGYVEGAFTGAVKGGRPGVFELAHGGTIFLDEISEMPLDIQGRLLRAIQEREIQRVGDGRVIPIDVRVICASNRPLRELMIKGEFRQDLYYRLNVLTLNIPPLRERREDIMALIQYYLDVYANRFSKQRPTLLPEASALLMEQDWRGNAREIRNVCERLTILIQSSVIDTHAVLRAISPEYPSIITTVNPQPKTADDNSCAVEREKILSVLRHNNYNKDAAAKDLFVSRTTLWRKMKLYNIPFERQ